MFVFKLTLYDQDGRLYSSENTASMRVEFDKKSKTFETLNPMSVVIGGEINSKNGTFNFN